MRNRFISLVSELPAEVQPFPVNPDAARLTEGSLRSRRQDLMILCARIGYNP